MSDEIQEKVDSLMEEVNKLEERKSNIESELAVFYQEANKKLEDILPNYYTDAEKNAAWYSYKKLFTANFFWDGIIKNKVFRLK